MTRGAWGCRTAYRRRNLRVGLTISSGPLAMIRGALGPVEIDGGGPGLMVGRMEALWKRRSPPAHLQTILRFDANRIFAGKAGI